jgi:hypothetical protein
VQVPILHRIWVTSSIVDPHHIGADPDSDFYLIGPTFYPEEDADPNPDPNFRLMWIRILPFLCGSGSAFLLMLIRILIFIWCGSRCGSGFLLDADADPGYLNDADPCGSGSTTLVTSIGT